MGSATKIVLVGAASLIIGIYSVSLKKVQTNDLLTSISQTTQVQSEKAVDMAIRASLHRVQYNRDLSASTAYTVTATRPLLGGGTYTYNFPCAVNQYTGIWGTVTVTQPTVDPSVTDVKVVDVRIDKVSGTNSTGAGTKPGFRRYVRGQWQVTQASVRPLL
jgi:hypothetical protein